MTLSAAKILEKSHVKAGKAPKEGDSSRQKIIIHEVQDQQIFNLVVVLKTPPIDSRVGQRILINQQTLSYSTDAPRLSHTPSRLSCLKRTSCRRIICSSTSSRRELQQIYQIHYSQLSWHPRSKNPSKSTSLPQLRISRNSSHPSQNTVQVPNRISQEKVMPALAVQINQYAPLPPKVPTRISHSSPPASLASNTKSSS